MRHTAAALVLGGILIVAACDAVPRAILGLDHEEPPVATSAPGVAALGAVASAAAAFVMTTTADQGPGSLRQAILDANSAGGPAVIGFDIPGAGPHIIRPQTILTPVQVMTLIDGYSQPGAQPNANSPRRGTNAVLMIVLDGSEAGSLVPGLVVEGEGSEVRGLVFHGFGGRAITLGGAGGHVVAGNFIGVDASGTVAPGNGLAGVDLWSPDNRIGWTAPADRNVISGNGTDASIQLNARNGVFVSRQATGGYADPGQPDRDRRGGGCRAAESPLGDPRLVGGRARSGRRYGTGRRERHFGQRRRRAQSRIHTRTWTETSTSPMRSGTEPSIHRGEFLDMPGGRTNFTHDAGVTPSCHTPACRSVGFSRLPLEPESDATHSRRHQRFLSLNSWTPTERIYLPSSSTSFSAALRGRPCRLRRTVRVGL